jgi:serine/threonine protein kinase
MARLSQPSLDVQRVHFDRQPNGALPWPGETIGGKYLVDGLCGKRGPALVFRASRLPLGECVAIELLEPERASHGIVVEQFLREGEAAMRIRGEHAVRILDEGKLESGAPYLVLEYVEGRTLEEVASTWGRLPLPTVVDWMLQAMEALAQAHSYGVVHGELTLARMFLTRSPGSTSCIKVDFGPRTMGCDADVGPDLLAVGVALQRLLFGSSLGSAAPLAGLPLTLEFAIRRCFEERTDRRFASVAELARALAPFGTPAARVSCERIECLLEDRAVELTRRKRPPAPRPPPRPVLQTRASRSDPTESMRPYVLPASGKVVLLALAMLIALGAAVFASLYRSVAREQQPPFLGATDRGPVAHPRA